MVGELGEICEICKERLLNGMVFEATLAPRYTWKISQKMRGQ